MKRNSTIICNTAIYDFILKIKWYSEMNASVKTRLKTHISNPVLNSDGLVQARRDPIANVLELRLSFTNPSIWNVNKPQFGRFD